MKLGACKNCWIVSFREQRVHMLGTILGVLMKASSTTLTLECTSQEL